VLGKTPLTLPLDSPDSRKLVVSLDGYLPYAFEQPPAQQNVRIVVPMAPAGAIPAAATQTAEASTKPKATPAPVVVKAVAPPPTAKPATPPPLDINMAR
jgi:hypothetical protein